MVFLCLAAPCHSRRTVNPSAIAEVSERKERRVAAKSGKMIQPLLSFCCLYSDSMIDVTPGKPVTDCSHVLGWADQPHSAAGHRAMKMQE